MIFAVLLGLLAVFAIAQLLRWYATADLAVLKRNFKRGLTWTGIGLLAVVAVFLAVTGRIGPALALLAGLTAWAWRVLQVIHLGRQFSGVFRSGFGRATGGARNSQVSSRYFSMRLDHATGAMDGDVREGRFAGRVLSSLSRAELLALRDEVRVDVDSLSLLDAYLDRVHPDWHDAAETHSNESAGPASSTMTADEAYRILGITPDADEAAIRAAYRRLMTQLHPDHGGTDYLAAKVNQAKDFLLKKRNVH